MGTWFTADLPSEAEVRARLAVPEDAAKVVVVAESTHWDPNWLLKAHEYYRLFVRSTLDAVLDALALEPRRVFTLECVYFVDLYWEDRPERRSQLRELANGGRLRFSGSGVTTPDTLLPQDETLLRDLLIGQEWLRTRAMRAEPRLLYLPDSFGHSPGLPALLQSAGIEFVALSRIDGMRFPGADMESARNFPRPGSSAEQLLSDGSADFLWRNRDGSELLTHWMSYGYGHGDMIGSRGLSRVMSLPTSWPDRSVRNVDRRVDRYIRELDRVSLTPYRLLVLGYDFVRPLSGLVEILDGRNDRHYERTGTWLVNASTEDYLDLVSFHRAMLPTVDLDPNPYWMGFYATRPDIKAKARTLGKRLVAIDAQLAVADLEGREPEPTPPSHKSAWWTAATSNHHDFITGTAPDRVALVEQSRWLDRALLQSPWPSGVSVTKLNSPRDSAKPTGSRQRGGVVAVAACWGTATFDASHGGTLVSITDSSGRELLTQPSLELCSYFDSGGLWRMGHEFQGGHWRLADRSSLHRATLKITRSDDRTEVIIETMLDGRVAYLEATIDLDDSGCPRVLTRTRLTARNRRTTTLVMSQRSGPTGLLMHQPGGIVRRPLSRYYHPTFWPLHSFAAVEARVATPGTSFDPTAPQPAVPVPLAVGTASPTAIHVCPNGSVEVVVSRTAVKEVAFRVIPVLAPAWGRRWGEQSSTLGFTWPDDHAIGAAVRSGRRLATAAERHADMRTPEWPIEIDPPHPDVEIIAVKPADRGDGTIIRLRDWRTAAERRPVDLRLPERHHSVIDRAIVVDSRERDRFELRVDTRVVKVPLDGHITSVRLMTRRI